MRYAAFGRRDALECLVFAHAGVVDMLPAVTRDATRGQIVWKAEMSRVLQLAVGHPRHLRLPHFAKFDSPGRSRNNKTAEACRAHATVKGAIGFDRAG